MRSPRSIQDYPGVAPTSEESPLFQMNIDNSKYSLRVSRIFEEPWILKRHPAFLESIEESTEHDEGGEYCGRNADKTLLDGLVVELRTPV